MKTAAIKKFTLSKILLTVALVGGLGIGSWWYFSAKSEGIYSYEAPTDRAFIIDLFKNDWYWLISDLSSKNYSVEHMLDYKASSAEKEGDLILKTYRIKGKPVGFIAYFPKELFIAQILFVSVDKAQRGRGYARKMVNFAINDMKKQGIRTVRMITRTDNTAAQKLYKSMGFVQIWTDGAYLLLEKKLD